MINIKSLSKALIFTGLLSSFTTFTFANVIKENNQLQNEMTKIESIYGGEIGFMAINTANNNVIGFHENTRFPMCSTYKFMVAAAILKKSMNDPDFLNKRIQYTKKDLIDSYSPYTKKNMATGMTISELSHAAILSDNSASNMLVKELGGVKELNQFARSIGDKSFRLDRMEPYLNTAIPGDLKDTSTPNAMAYSLQKIAFGNTLETDKKNMLLSWLKNNTTGDNRIRAGVPKDWIVGDKTGTCSYGTTNDVGIIWPKNCAPIIISVFYTQQSQNALPKDQIIRKITASALSELSKTDKCLSNGLG